MRRVKEKIYDHLYACQQQCGGYTGKDIEEIARTCSVLHALTKCT